MWEKIFYVIAAQRKILLELHVKHEGINTIVCVQHQLQFPKDANESR